MNRSLLLTGRQLFRLLFSIGIVGTICQLFFEKYGGFIIPVSVVLASVLNPIPMYVPSFNHEITKKGSLLNEVKNDRWLLLLPLIFICSEFLYSPIKDFSKYDIDHTAWSVATSLIFFKIVLHFLLMRI